MLKGKNIVLGVSGGIACFKAASLASMLTKQHADVQVIMTENATKFVTPLTFANITGNRVLVDAFDLNFEHHVEHIAVADKADFVLVAPATANVLAKFAHGMADDMLTTTVLACSCPKAAAPAMNTKMYENPVTRDNLELLRKYGWNIIEPASGHLACGTTGAGRLPEPEELLEFCLHELARDKDLTGKKILVTAGPTREALDPVRFLTNRSSGKMGFCLARAASRRGAEVTLVSGPVSIAAPRYVNLVKIESAQEMFDEVTKVAKNMDIIIKAAAVADYCPETVTDEKIKKHGDEMSIPLKRTPDILEFLGKNKPEGQLLCGFSMETTDLIANSRKKLEKKNLDMIAANNVKTEGAGFGVDTNVLTLITGSEEIALPLLSKDAAADAILDQILRIMAT